MLYRALISWYWLKCDNSHNALGHSLGPTRVLRQIVGAVAKLLESPRAKVKIVTEISATGVYAL